MKKQREKRKNKEGKIFWTEQTEESLTFHALKAQLFSQAAKTYTNIYFKKQRGKISMPETSELYITYINVSSFHILWLNQIRIVNLYNALGAFLLLLITLTVEKENN